MKLADPLMKKIADFAEFVILLPLILVLLVAPGLAQAEESKTPSDPVLELYDFVDERKTIVKDPEGMSWDEARRYVPQFDESQEMMSMHEQEAVLFPLQAVLSVLMEMLDILVEIQQNNPQSQSTEIFEDVGQLRKK